MPRESEPEINTIRFGLNTFRVEHAFFRRITQSWAGPGLDFMISGRLIQGDRSLFPHGAHIEAEAAPIPLNKATDYMGVELNLPGAYDEESGEPYFGLRIVKRTTFPTCTFSFGPRTDLDI